jgi:hypothetical protein
MSYTPTPFGPFVEVPYHLSTCWTAGGFTWNELEAAGGLPDVVLGRLSEKNRDYCRKAVFVWASLADYRTATGLQDCRIGRAWLEPGTDSTVPVRYLTGRMSAPMVVGPRRKWRW